MNRTDWFLTIWVFVLLAYVFAAAVWLPRQETVSVSLAAAARRYPIVGVMVGLVIGLFLGHVFWGGEP